jgi:formylglycine-generating enzyme required for sulfatase activity
VPSLFQPGDGWVLEMQARATTEPEPADMPAAPVLEFEWIRIPAGKFQYGRPGSTIEVELDEFEIMKHEVTNQQWQEYLWSEKDWLMRRGVFNQSVPRNWGWDPGAGEFEFPQVPSGLHDLPVVYITWTRANDFCTRYLPKKLKCREAYLPTSEQWEMAARGTEDVRRYPWGDEATIDRGGFRELRCNVRETGLRRAVDVQLFPADKSFFGVMGMAGNVAEFVGDPERNYMAYKAGSYEDPVIDAQIHIETVIPPRSTFTWRNVGFRAARRVDEEK